MAKGYPDYFGQSIFPYRGPLKRYDFLDSLSVGELGPLNQVVGKGVVLGIEFRLYPDTGNEKSLINLFVDSEIVDTLVLESWHLNETQVSQGPLMRLDLLSYIHKFAQVNLSREFEYSSDVGFQVSNLSGTDVLGYNLSVYVSEIIG